MWFLLFFLYILGYLVTQSKGGNANKKIRHALCFLFCVIPVFFGGFFILILLFIFEKINMVHQFSSVQKMYNFLGHLWLGALTYLGFTWSGVRFQLLDGEGNSLSLEHWREKCMENRTTLSFSNHCDTEFDGMPFWFLNLTNFPWSYTSTAMVKKEFKYLVPLGGIISYIGSVFLDRQLEQDKLKIKNWLNTILTEFPQPLFMGFFPEGTRNNPERLAAGQRYAKEQGYPVMNHLLVPRTGGFHLIVQHLRQEAYCPEFQEVKCFKGQFPIEEFCDFTLHYSPVPNKLLPWVKGDFDCKVCTLVVDSIDITEMPVDRDDFGVWLRELWTKKDKLKEDLSKGKYAHKKTISTFSIHLFLSMAACQLFTCLLFNVLGTFVWLFGFSFWLSRSTLVSYFVYSYSTILFDEIVHSGRR